MKLGNGSFVVSAILALLLLTAPAIADEVLIDKASPAVTPEVMPEGTAVPMLSSPADAYAGTLRIYIVEPRSRWLAADAAPYEMGFLEFATVEALSIPDSDRYEQLYTWSGATNGWLVSETNVMAIAVVFRDDGVTTDAYPGNGAWYTAYYVDGAAGAAPGETVESYIGSGWTHSVFVEEATATWCGHCPGVRDKLGQLYENPSYHFFFVALVDDENDNAHDRIYGDLNIGAWPTTFFDCGDEVVVGNQSISFFQSALNSAGGRDANGIQLMTSVEWTGVSQLNIRVAIGNGVAPNTAPTSAAVTAGNTTVLEDEMETYTGLGSDPDAQELEYQWDWGDGNTSDWIGPYDDGVSCTHDYAWADPGVFDVKVRARDTWGLETDWSPAYTVTVEAAGCCDDTNARGNTDDSPDDAVTLGDLTVLIDNLFISLSPLACWEEGNLDGSLPEGEGSVTLGDLTVMIDHLFISLTPLPACP
ncbi:hypothetical protein GF377_04115 [candidate division GN15 bacterium]|nr:hypothetical protein [candidate division GN15 bacterium]